MSDHKTNKELVARFAPLVEVAVKDFPGRKAGFYHDKLAELFQIGMGEQTWPPTTRVLEQTLRALREGKRIKYAEGGWHPDTTPVCPHCKRLWPEKAS